MKALARLGQRFFISLQKLFSFLRKSNFRISDFQISWFHQMPKHKTRITLYWITWVVKKIISSTNSAKTEAWKLVPDPFVFANLLENEIQICNSKAIKISPNQHAGLLRFLFTEGSLKITKDLELVSRSQFS